MMILYKILNPAFNIISIFQVDSFQQEKEDICVFEKKTLAVVFVLVLSFKNSNSFVDYLKLAEV